MQKNDFIWAALFHMGMNMWDDYRALDHLEFNENVWRTLTGRMAEVGMNMVVIDLGEAIRYPSHPELAVKGSWEIDRFRRELARLRALGLEPIPKMNFSTSHDVWLGEYHRMISTEPYYQVCADLIRDVAEIFNHPRFLHLGFDEEFPELQGNYLYSVARQGDLWWHDFLWFVKETEKAGMRPWIWSDYAWHHHALFYKRMPRSVLQSNFYYEKYFDMENLVERCKTCPEQSKRLQKFITGLKTYEELDKAGFDQIPCGSNWTCDTNFADTVKHCRKVCSPDRLKGFLMAPWFFTIPEKEKKNLEAIDQVGAVIKAERRTFAETSSEKE